MNLDDAKAQVDAMTAAVKQQMAANKESVANQLDASDRIIMRKAADTVLTIVPAVVANPT